MPIVVPGTVPERSNNPASSSAIPRYHTVEPGNEIMAPVASVSSTNSNKSQPGKKRISNSLGSLLHYMEGIEVIVELKTGKRHQGILASADEFMNLTLEGVNNTNAASASAERAAVAVSSATSISSTIRPGTSPAWPQHQVVVDDDKQQQQQEEEDITSSGWHPANAPVSKMENIIYDTTRTIYSSLDIRGSNIRYIHFPDNADLSTLVKAGVDRERAAAKKYSRGKRKK